MKEMSNNNTKGKEGEDFAIGHLLKNGYQLLEKNWRHKHLEIDLIAKHNETLVIVEVKLRSSNAFGQPENFVSIKKQKNTIKAAHAYIIENNLNYETRFDIISIIQNSNEFSLEHIVSAFYPTLK
jgi:putative endonuclease